MAACPLLLAAWLANIAWILAWSVLAGLTVLLVVLLRTRLRDAKPWKKCAILSLWVHVLLATLTAMVRIASSGPGYGAGYGPGESIRISILPAEYDVADAGEDDETIEGDDATEQEVEDNEEPIVAAAEVETPPQKPDKEPAALARANNEDLEAPTLLVEPTPPAPGTQIPTPQPVAAAPPATPAQETAPEPQPTAVVANATLSAEAIVLDSFDAVQPPAVDAPAIFGPLTLSPDLAVPPIGAAVAAPSSSAPVAPPGPPRPAAYANRSVAKRAQAAASGGGNGQTEAAVNAALAWLAAAQEEDGRWDAKRHGAGREIYTVLGQDRGTTGAKADTGVGGLALLAFLGAGHTHREGDYSANVGRGLSRLQRTQRADGDLSGEAEFFARMYCHSMATFAAAEAFAMSRDDALRPMVERGVGYSLEAQHQVDGGWRYLPGQQGDTSQLGWQLMALKSAQTGELAVPAVTWTRMERFLRQVERGHAGGLAAYQPAGPPTRSMTAEALFCRQLLAGRGDGGLSRAALGEAIDSLVTELPSGKQVNLYYWYYATLALHQAQHASPEAAEAWRRWNDALTRTLLATQTADGSWPANCLWGGYGGRVYTTSLACLCLEVYYRYAPPAGKGNVAQRSEWQAVPR